VIKELIVSHVDHRVVNDNHVRFLPSYRINQLFQHMDIESVVPPLSHDVSSSAGASDSLSPTLKSSPKAPSKVDLFRRNLTSTHLPFHDCWLPPQEKALLYAYFQRYGNRITKLRLSEFHTFEFKDLGKIVQYCTQLKTLDLWGVRRIEFGEGSKPIVSSLDKVTITRIWVGTSIPSLKKLQTIFSGALVELI
jgi:hypothetical protein